MMDFRMSWLLTIIILSFMFNNLSEARHEKNLPSAVVVGTVYCDTCFQEDFSKSSHFISGALVAVECGETGSKPSFRKEVKTNEHGEFKVHLPFSVSKHVKKIKGCSVKLISSSESDCAVASAATSSSLHFKSRKQGTHIFSAGFFSFKPLNQPDLCNQKPSSRNSKNFNSMKPLLPNPNNSTFLPPIENPPTPTLPPIGQDLFPPLPPLPTLPPLPQLPPLPPLPGLPYLPPVPIKATATNSLKTSQFSDKNEPQQLVLPPNPFRPPSIFPPNPFQPPPSVLPPIFPTPSPPFFNFPPIPGLTPSPPPPPAFPFPLPPFPFQPSPGNPPPASSSSLKEASP